MEEDNELDKLTHFLLVGLEDEENFSVVHIVAFLEEPTEETIDAIRQELREDPEFGLQNIADQLEYRVIDNTFEDFDAIKARVMAATQA